MVVEEESQGGRFSSLDRHIVDEGTLHLTSVGVDIGSSTSHLIFSQLQLELEDNRYVVTDRKVLNQSEILLTPYTDDRTTIDGEVLGRFIDKQYEIAGVSRDDVDTGALILTGVALLRDNARAIAELFAEEAGKFVSVSAGDNLEAIMAAYGSGAMGLAEKEKKAIMNIDMGGGTTKIVVCAAGKPQTVAAIDVGARLVARKDGTIIRLEEQGRQYGQEIGLTLAMGQKISDDEMQKLAAHMANRLMEHISLKPLSPEAAKLLRTPALTFPGKIDAYTFSGGVSEFIYNREPGDFGDLGPFLAKEIRQRVEATGSPILEPEAGIRATVIGASQYSVQVSGSTIYISPSSAVPVRNISVINPDFDLHDDDPVDSDDVAARIKVQLDRYDLGAGHTPVAIGMHWSGGATFDRIDGFCHGVMQGMKSVLDNGHPLVLVYDGDIGGLIGIHFKEELHIMNPIISIDGIDLKEFDFIDVGSLIPSSGAVPVVIKSLIFSVQTN